MADNVFVGFPVVVPDVNIGAAVADITGTLTGTTNSVMENIADIAISTSGGNTYSDAVVNTAVNAAILTANLELKELLVKLNALLAELRTGKIIAT